jgi:hypothetical protein
MLGSNLSPQVYTLTYESWDGSDASDAHHEASAEEQPAANPVRSVKHSGGHTLVRHPRVLHVSTACRTRQAASVAPCVCRFIPSCRNLQTGHSYLKSNG